MWDVDVAMQRSSDEFASRWGKSLGRSRVMTEEMSTGYAVRVVIEKEATTHEVVVPRRHVPTQLHHSTGLRSSYEPKRLDAVREHSAMEYRTKQL